MSSSSGSTVEQSNYRSWSHCGGSEWTNKCQWTGVNIAAMVVSFIVFWPLGLFVLYWISTGRNALELPGIAKRKLTGISTKWGRNEGSEKHSRFSDNAVFNAFQLTQYDRIREIKDEIKERSRRFNDYRVEARRRSDEEEFRRFMADAPVSDKE